MLTNLAMKKQCNHFQVLYASMPPSGIKRKEHAESVRNHQQNKSLSMKQMDSRAGLSRPAHKRGRSLIPFRDAAEVAAPRLKPRT